MCIYIYIYILCIYTNIITIYVNCVPSYTTVYLAGIIEI